MIKDIERIKELLLDKGLTKAVVNGKTPAIVLGVVLENPNIETAFDCVNSLPKLVEEKSRLEKEVEELRKERQNLLSDMKATQLRLADYEKFNKVEDAVKAKNEYIEQFNESLKACETKEGRDKLRIVQIFVNTVSCNTDANNTAFIHGLATILAGGDFSIPALMRVDAIKERDYETKPRWR